MRYLLLLILTLAFFAQVQAQTETRVLENAILNDYSVSTDTQTVISGVDTTYDITYVNPPVDSTILSIDTLIDTSYVTQYRFSVDVGGFGTMVPLSWKDSADHVDFANGIVLNKMNNVWRAQERLIDFIFEAMDANTKIGVKFLQLSRDSLCNGCIDGTYTLEYKNLSGPIAITGRDIFDTNGVWAGVNADIGNILYFTGSESLLFQFQFADGESVILSRKKGTKILRGLDDNNRKVILTK